MEVRPFTLRQAVHAIYSRKGRVVLFAGVIFALVVMATIMAKKSYYSDAKLFVRLGRENVGLDPTATLGEGPALSVPISREDEINSIVELIKSKELLANVVDEIGPERILDRNEDSADDSPPSLVGSMVQKVRDVGLMSDISNRERAIIGLEKNIGVVAARKSNVISVAFESYNAELARQVVSSLVDGYMQKHTRLHRGSGAVDFLQNQTENALKQLQEAEKSFEYFKNRTGLLSLVEQRKVLIERMARLENDYLLTVAQSDALYSEMEQLKARFANLEETVVISRTVGAGNQGFDGMATEMYRLKIKYEEQKSIKSENHPSVQQLKKQLEESEKILAAAQAQTTESVRGRNSVYDKTLQDLVTKEPQFKSLVTKAQTQKKQLNAIQQKLTEFTANETEFLEMQRAVLLREEKYRRFAKNLQQAEIDYSLESQRISNIEIAQAATLNPKPIRPKALINLVLGLFAGVVGGCALAVLLEYFSAPAVVASEGESSSERPSVSVVPGLSLGDAHPSEKNLSSG